MKRFATIYNVRRAASRTYFRARVYSEVFFSIYYKKKLINCWEYLL